MTRSWWGKPVSRTSLHPRRKGASLKKSVLRCTVLYRQQYTLLLSQREIQSFYFEVLNQHPVKVYNPQIFPSPLNANADRKAAIFSLGSMSMLSE